MGFWLQLSCGVWTGGSDLAGADREDLEQLERAVRGRLLEVQILKLSAQCRAAHNQFEAYLDVASSAVKPKVWDRSGTSINQMPSDAVFM